MREERDSVPVWIPDSDFASCYDEFCHQVLWPALHYAVPDAPKTKAFYESATYKQYVAVNQRFADAIVSAYNEGDIIWVNDYHLMLLPSMLRERLPNAAIGFFMHVAFPSSEIFRCLSVREPLLHGVLGADLIKSILAEGRTPKCYWGTHLVHLHVSVLSRAKIYCIGTAPTGRRA